jgi:hypothetical protein
LKSELQAALAGAFGKRLDAAVKEVSVAIKDHLGHASFGGSFGHGFSNVFR